LTRKESNSAPVADTHCRCNAFVELKFNALRVDKFDEAVAVRSRITADLGMFGKLLPSVWETSKT